jgi:serpin B
MRRTLTTLTALTLVLAACAQAGPSPTPTSPTPTLPEGVQLLKASLPRETTTDVTPAELIELVGGNTALAFDLYRIASEDGGNVILSPYSIAAALTMSYAGARGDTASEMRDALRLGLSDERVHAARNHLDLLITAEPVRNPDDEREPFSIRVANSLWGQAGYPFLDEFLAVLAANYDAGMNLVDFQTAAEDARQMVNDWVEAQTEGRIVDLIPEGAVDELTRLILVNAIWFKAAWFHEFDPELTADGPWNLLDGSTTSAPLMKGGGRTGYFEGDGFEAINLPYVGEASMIVVVPDSGRFAEIAAGFGPADLEALRSSWGDYEVDLTFPKFEFSADLNLNDTLKRMGMVAAFTDPRLPDGADFTGIVAARELFITDVVHQAFISVDEIGTEAAAATAVLFGVTSMPQSATLVVDRPFLFFIQHTGTGEILFLGQVVDPR